jgi:hypothetical protein
MSRSFVPLVLFLCTSAASAQISTGFEPPAYGGSAAGTQLAGQNGWYNPVAGSADLMPTDVRLFAGGASGGNLTAWDNFSVVPSPGTGALLSIGFLAAARRRRR